MAQHVEVDDFSPAVLNKSQTKIRQYNPPAIQQGEQASLISIDQVASSSGPMTPRFIFKGTVNNAVYVQDSLTFTNLINGSSLNSVSVDDGGQFYVSVGLSPVISRMFRSLDRLLTIRSAMYEMRFGNDDAGLAFDFITGKIFKIPFTIWDVNGTPNNPEDDEEMLIQIYNGNFSSPGDCWGIRTDAVSPWTNNPAHESDWIYFNYYETGSSPELLQQQYNQQELTGLIDSRFHDIMINYTQTEVLARITINSLDQNPLTTLNNLNGLARPRAGTIIRWNFYVPLDFINEKLYTAAGENFVFKPKVRGIPKPTITTVQLPNGMTFNNVNSELTWVADTTQSGFQDIILQANNEQGSVQNTYKIWVDRYTWNSADHNNNNVLCSVFNNGDVGHTSPSGYYTDLLGSGFSYFGLNALTRTTGSLTIAISDTQISGVIDQNKMEHSYATGTMVNSVQSLIPYFSQSFQSEFSDVRAEYPVGVKVLQCSYSKSTSPDNNYIIIDYNIKNTNSITLNGLYVGLNLDFDVGGSGLNLVGYDAERQLSYIYNADGVSNSNFYGQALLNKPVSGHSVQWEEFGFSAMQALVTVPTDTNDYRSFLSSGPYSVPAGKSIRVTYALAAGLNLSDLQATIDAARAVNLNRKPMLANQIPDVNLIMGSDFVRNLTATPPVFEDLDQNTLSFSAQSSNTGAAQASVTASVLTVHPLGQGSAIITVQANDNNGGITSTTFNVAVGMAPLVTTETATNITPVSAQFNSTVNPAGLECRVFFEYGLTTSYGDTAWALQNPVSGTSDVTPYAVVYNLESNTQYHYRAGIQSSLGTDTATDGSFFTEAYPANVTINRTYNFPLKSDPGEYIPQDYRIIGLPGRAEQNMASFLGGTQGEDWQMYWDNGGVSNFMVRYDGSGAFTLTPGKAFWIVHKGNWNLDYVFLSATLNSNEEVEIPLENGWNLITNPFPQNMTWTSIQSLNGISDPIWSYQGGSGFQQVSIFASFQGYYYFNAGNAPLLRIPYRELFINPIPKSTITWQGRIRLETAVTTDAACWFGVSTLAERNLDKLDYRKPRAIGDLPVIYFLRTEWDKNYSTFGSDIRPEIEKVETWPLEVYIPVIQEEASLTIEEISSVPSALEVYLLDRELLKYQNMRDNPRYDFKAVKKISCFELVIGKKEAVLAEIDHMVPVKFDLGQNFPNPFNPTTTIPVSIPSTAQATLVIYTMLGQEVITLFNGKLEVGRHYLVWDGNGNDRQRMSSGIYLYRLTTDKGVNLTGKMVMVK
jgi:hypothetical protein